MNKNFFIIPIFIISIAIISVCVDFFSGYTKTIPRENLVHYAKFIGSFAIGSLAFSGSYFTARVVIYSITTFSPLQKPPQPFPFFLSILRYFHTVAGSIAFCLVFVHGYLFFFRLYSMENNKFIISGFSAFCASLVVILLGAVLLFKPEFNVIRIFHRIFGFITAIFATFHLSLIRLLWEIY